MELLATVPHTDDPAPALTRGLRLLDELVRSGPCSLETLTRTTGFPKSSALRILQSLEHLGAVQRDPGNREFHARLRLTPVASTDPSSWPERVAPTLAPLAERYGYTAELYAVHVDHAVMIDRAEPRNTEVRVTARVGFRRDFDEFEAVTQTCLTWNTDTLPPGRPKLWYWDQAQRTPLRRQEVLSCMDRIRAKRAAYDLGLNTNGIRRYAAPLTQQGRLVGVLALAQFCPPHRTELMTELLEAVSHTAHRIHLD